MRYRLNVNDRVHEIDAPSGISLLSALRDDLGLTGTRFGCGHGVCGAYPHEIAETKVALVHDQAREHGFPLRASMEEE